MVVVGNAELPIQFVHGVIHTGGVVGVAVVAILVIVVVIVNAIIAVIERFVRVFFAENHLRYTLLFPSLSLL